MLEPLKQWICDRCGEVIEKPEDGWVGWDDDENGDRHAFEIVHHFTASPRDGQMGCYRLPDGYLRDMHLHHMIGAAGLLRLMAMIDVGQHHDPRGTDRPRVKSFREWRDLLLRLTVPYYEEARQFYGRALSEEFADSSEVDLYLPSTSKNIIETYADED